MRSRRPWCFSRQTTAVTSPERNCLWMAASPRCKALGRNASEQGLSVSVASVPPHQEFLYDNRFSRPTAVVDTRAYLQRNSRTADFIGRVRGKGEHQMAKIVRFHKLGGPDVLHIEEVPSRQPSKGEVSLRVQAMGLNRAESMFMHGSYLEPTQLPATLGYEASGIVTAIGAEVD